MFFVVLELKSNFSVVINLIGYLMPLTTKYTATVHSSLSHL